MQASWQSRGVARFSVIRSRDICRNSSLQSQAETELGPVLSVAEYCGRTKVRRTVYVALAQGAKPFSP